ncbi:MAG: tetratricopeptide repeat protein [Burkholderiales bacterium]
MTCLLAIPAFAQAPIQAVPRGKPVPPANLPAVDLSQELMYKLMLGEIALQRGQPQVAVQAFLEVARETRDPRVAQRATEMAWNARMQKEALEAASIWQKADPNSPQARQVMATLLVNQEQLGDAQPHLEQWLAADKANAGQNFVQLAQLLGRHKDKKSVLDLMRALARPYNDIAEVRLAVAQAAWNASDVELSLAESRAAMGIKPDLQLAALFHVQALQRRSNAEALAFLEDYLKRNPKASDVRLNYARLLVIEKRQADARAQFELLVAEAPKNAELALAVAMLALQANDYDAAEKHLKGALAAGHKESDLIWLSLGQVAEERKQYDEALKWYGGVTAGDRYMAAQARYAGVLVKQGKMDEARKYLQTITPRNDAQRIQLVQAEANLLREAQAYQDAYNLLGKSLEGAPDSVDLLYDQAMIAEKLDRIDVLERNLKRVVELQPDHAHAYNALGYTLADRNQRLPEARKLIEKALELAPQDAYIIDSLGWVLYRMGQRADALKELRRAFALRQDADVGAHLGEVLWVDGKRDEAQKIWTDLLKGNPTNETLQGTIKRFAPALLPAVK